MFNHTSQSEATMRQIRVTHEYASDPTSTRDAIKAEVVDELVKAGHTVIDVGEAMDDLVMVDGISTERQTVDMGIDETLAWLHEEDTCPDTFIDARDWEIMEVIRDEDGAPTGAQRPSAHGGEYALRLQAYDLRDLECLDRDDQLRVARVNRWAWDYECMREQSAKNDEVITQLASNYAHLSTKLTELIA
jgi:hypothetical protein